MMFRSELDAIIIADSGDDTLSGTNPLKLKLNGRVGDIQVVKNYIHHKGRVTPPVDGDNKLSWSSAPKLNGLYLFSYLTKHNFNVALIKNYVREKEHFQKLLSGNPKAVILSTPFIFFKKKLKQLVDDIRSIAPDIFIIAGGAFINYSYLLLHKAADADYETDSAAGDFLFLQAGNEPDINLYIVSPRGEDTLCLALQRLAEGLSPNSLGNTAHLAGGSYVFTARDNDISTVPPPDVDWNALPSSVFETGVIPLQASNGCPYNCSFCNFTKDRRLMFVKPLDQLVAEIKSVEQRGIKYVWFIDDNFRLGSNDLNAVSKRFIEEDIQAMWMCFIRASSLKSADMELLRKAGCIEVQIGLESGDPQILRNMNKKADPEMYMKVIGNVMTHGINVSCYFISGFPGEPKTTAQTTRDFIRSIENPDAAGSLSWSIYPFILSPLSPVYEPAMRKKFGLTGYLQKWMHSTMNYEEAKQLVLKAFFELENSVPIYRGDNLNLLGELSHENKKDFFRARHYLSKKLLKNELSREELIRTFNEIL